MAAKKKNEGVEITNPSSSSESQKDLTRARSGWQTAVEADYMNHKLWLEYAEMEMNNKCMDHARSVLECAVAILPQIDQLWCKYIQMEEEILGNVNGARHVFHRWVNWMPDQPVWISYIDFELRYNEIERARVIFERFVQCHPTEWIRYVDFEMKNGEASRARNCCQRAIAKLAADYDAKLRL